MKNLNLIFNKLYYSKINTVDFEQLKNNPERQDAATRELDNSLKDYNEEIFGTVFDHERDYMGLEKRLGKELAEKAAPHRFLMKTVYPGLLIGSGNPHGAQLCDSDINNGFSFDYVSGQPYIPGSSVKGMLRSCFKDSPDAVAEIIRAVVGENKSVTVSDLEKEIFDGKDIFFDAVVYAGDTKGKLIGPDYITPHPSETLAPKPIHILKVVPGVRFMFEFRFLDGILTAAEKVELMKAIIGIFGMGAKTNAGYGRMQFTDDGSLKAAEPEADADTIICIRCGREYRLNDFEKNKVKNDGWVIKKCYDCVKKEKNKAERK